MRIDRRLLTLAFGGLFWRTFALIALLIAVSIAAWFQSFRVIEREPRAQRVALQLVAVVKLTRTALLYSDPDLRRALLQDLESNEGVRVYPRETTDKYRLQPDESLNRLIERDVRGRLGNDTIIAQSVNDIPGVWISFKIDDDDYWVALDRDQLDNVTGLQWAGWGVFALALSLFGAAFITSLVNRPFARLALAARKVGSGQSPEPLPERGMGVAAETNRSFNQMVQALEQLEADRALMLAGISHDLRTPLARLRLETEMSPSDETTKLAMIDDIEQMDMIIGRFLDYARPMQRMPEAVDLSMIAGELAARFHSDEGVVMKTRARVRRDDRGRSDGRPARGRQLAGERAQVRAQRARRRRAHHAADPCDAWPRGTVGDGRRPRHSRRPGRADHAPVLSRRYRAHAGERHRARHGDRAAARDASARFAALAQPHAGSGLRGHDRLPGGQGHEVRTASATNTTRCKNLSGLSLKAIRFVS